MTMYLAFVFVCTDLCCFNEQTFEKLAQIRIGKFFVSSRVLEFGNKLN